MQLDGVRQDFRLAVRSLARQKAWTTVALATLALGIGANSALFTVVNAVLIRPLPYPQAERVLSLSESDKGVDRGVVSDLTYGAWSRSARSLSAVAAYGAALALVRGSDESERVRGVEATPSYFFVMGVSPARGRTFTADESRPGGPAVVLLSDQLWRRMFGADTGLVGRSVLFDGNPHTVVGVMSPSFTTALGPQYWTPLRLGAAPLGGTTFYYEVVARRRPGVSIDGVRAELAALSRRLDAERPVEQRDLTPVVMTLRDRLFGDARPALLILLAAVGVLLLIACANVCNLLLARGARREHEFAVRLALGANRWRLMRGGLVESLVLSLGGALLGLLVAFLTVPSILRIAPAVIARVERIEVDGTVLGFTFAVSIGTALLFGLIPSIRAAHAGLGVALSASGRTTSNPRHRVGWALIVFELATALVLVTCAGLLTRSFASVTAIDLGFRPAGVLVANIELPSDRYAGDAAQRVFAEVLERAKAIPGVRSAAVGDGAPLRAVGMRFSVRYEDGRQSPVIHVIGVSPRYFGTVGTPLLAGRDFEPTDGANAPRVAVLNATSARLMYAGVEPIGRRVDLPGGQRATVVGVVKDVPQRELEAGPEPAIFIPFQQAGSDTRMTVLIWVDGDPLDLRVPFRQVLRSIDPVLPVPEFTTTEQILSDAVAPRRFGFVLLTTFALLAVTLAAGGLYGIMAYVVAERTRELGVRLALGAEPRGVVRLVVWQGMRLATIGTLLGVAGSAAAVRLLRNMLFGVSVYDLWTFAAGAAILVAAALLACWVPAQRAAAVDPILALRSE